MSLPFRAPDQFGREVLAKVRSSVKYRPRFESDHIKLCLTCPAVQQVGRAREMLHRLHWHATRAQLLVQRRGPFHCEDQAVQSDRITGEVEPPTTSRAEQLNVVLVEHCKMV